MTIRPCSRPPNSGPRPEGLGAFASLVGVLRAWGVRQPLVPLPAESVACAMLRTFAADLVGFNFVVKRLGDSPSLPARSISTSAIDPGRRVHPGWLW